MAERQQGKPTTWAQLLAPERANLSKEIVETLSPSSSRAVNELGGVSNTFSSLIVLLGPGEAAALAKPLVALANDALRNLEMSSGSTAPIQVINVLSFMNAAESCGAAAGLLSQELLAKWLERLAKRRREMKDEQAYRAALVALAAGDPELAAKLAGGGKLPARFTPGETFGFNVQGLARYFAAAIVQKATADDVRPAFVDFARAFPIKKAAGTLDWNDLFWAARVFYNGFEGRPVAEVGAALHALVRTL